MHVRRVALFLAALGIVAVPATVVAATTAGDPGAIATLTVTGSGLISRPPDLATVAVTIVTHDDNAGRALSDNNRRFGTLTAKLRSTGIAPADIVSTSISSYVNQRPPVPPPDAAGQLYGTIVTRSVTINVASLDATGSVVDIATTSGATQIDGVSYGFRDRRAVERGALAAAVTDAYAQAQVMAAAAHVQIVRILRLGGDGGGRGPIAPMAMAMARKANDSVPTSIAPSNLDVSSSVTVTYVIR